MLFFCFCDSEAPICESINLDVYPENCGTIERSPDKESYSYGEKVTLTAISFSGYSFFRWYGDSDSKNDSIVVEFNDNEQNYTASFVKAVLGDGIISICKYPSSTLLVGENAIFDFALNLPLSKTYTVSATANNYDKIIFSYKSLGDAIGVNAGISFDKPVDISLWNIKVLENDMDSVILDTLINYSVVWSNALLHLYGY